MSKIVKSVNRLASTINNSMKNGNNKKRKNSRRRGRVGRPTSRGPQGILAGYGSPIQSVFSQKRIADGLIVRGFDLVTAFSGDHNISYFMPANPVLWPGTRIAAIASGFQNYRPLKFVIHYRPQVGSDSILSMFIGTIWQNNYITGRDQIEPSLVTSPGGVYEPAWQSSMTEVKCGNNLPQRMYPIRDPSYTTIPFSVVARAAAGDSLSRAVEMPGRIFIEYTYEFRNAIGLGSGYGPAQLHKVDVHLRKTAGASVWSPTAIASADRTPVKGQIIDYSGWRAGGGDTTLEVINWLASNNAGMVQPGNVFPLFASATWEKNADTGTYTDEWSLQINGTTLDINDIISTAGPYGDVGSEYDVVTTLTVLTQGALPS